MKPLNKMNDVEKGKLLFELFPDEMPLLIAFIKEFTQSITRSTATVQTASDGTYIAELLVFQIEHCVLPSPHPKLSALENISFSSF